jgi:ABC-type branched-subunit amino acid transport system ATPase component
MADLIQRAYVMEKGRIVWQGTASALMHNEELKLAYLGV